MNRPLTANQLPNDPQQLKSMLVEAMGKIQWFEEQFRLQRHKQFSSGDRWPDQSDFFNEAEIASKAPEPDMETVTYDRKKPGPKGLPKDLPRSQVFFELPVDQRDCECCGCSNGLKEFSRSVTERLILIPARAEIEEQVVFKYACQCCGMGVKAAPHPKPPIPGSYASASALAWVICAKFMDAMPLYRQGFSLKRMKLDITRATLAGWMIKSASLLSPIYERLHALLVERDYMAADETPIQVLKEEGKKAQSKSYMWLYRSGQGSDKPIILFDYQPGRGAEHPMTFLKGFKGYLQTDSFSSYHALAKARPEIIPLGCMAHAQVKFKTALDARPVAPDPAHPYPEQIAMGFIKQLYAIERHIKDMEAIKRKAIRKRKSNPILKQFRKWLIGQATGILPKGYLAKAVKYALNNWIALTRYLADGRLSIDNNYTEREIRPFVIGRRNWLFADTSRGAQSSAILYSLVATVKACGLDPYQWFCYVLNELPQRAKGDDIDDLLPFNMSAKQLENLALNKG